jgi:hypothetical protein
MIWRLVGPVLPKASSQNICFAYEYIFLPPQEYSVHWTGLDWTFPHTEDLPRWPNQKSYTVKILQELHERTFTKGKWHSPTNMSG